MCGREEERGTSLEKANQVHNLASHPPGHPTLLTSTMRKEGKTERDRGVREGGRERERAKRGD